MKKAGHFEDPVMKPRRVRLHLADRLVDSRMLGTPPHCAHELSFFAVVKKAVPLAEACKDERYAQCPLVRGHHIQQRLLMDERTGNCLWEEPPRTQLTSPEVMSEIDLSHRARRGGSVAQWKATLPITTMGSVQSAGCVPISWCRG